jgi:DNA polymerase
LDNALNNPPTRLLPYQIPLNQAGYPTSVLMLDFECFFSKDYSLKKMGVFEYVADPRFAVLGCAFKVVGTIHSLFEFGAQRVTTQLSTIKWDELTIAGQNLPFDAWILAKKFGIYPRYTVDVLDLARAWDAEAKHDLDTLAITFNVGRKGRTLDFEGVTEANATPEQQKALAEYACNDVELQDKLLRILLPRLTNPAVEIPLAHATLEMRTKPTLVCDNKLGDILVSSMKREANASIERLGLTVKDISCEATFQSHLEAALVESGDLLQRYCKPTKRGYAPALAKEDSMREVLLNHPSQRVRDLCEAKVGRRSWQLHIARVERIMRIAKVCDGLLPCPLNYHAAHTGRDGGAEKINLQNLAKHGPPVLIAMRGLIKTAPGQRLIRDDLNAIEPRCLFWLADEKQGLEDFRRFDLGLDSFDIYVKFASTCLEKVLEAIIDAERGQIGKVGVLGCGYGMGAYLPESNKSLPNKLFLENGLDVTMAEKVVYTYRRVYASVCRLWGNLESAFRRVVDKGLPVTVGKLKLFATKDCPVEIELPSTRRLRYHNACIRSGYLQLGNVPIWGGAITENVTQAVARDILMEGVLRLNTAGLTVRHRVHDEVIIQHPLEGIEEAKVLANKILCTPPKWALDLPLAGKAKIACRYGV